MTDLFTDAQAVLDAFNREARPEPHHQREAIAAALRVVADEGESFYDPCEGRTSAVRTDWILAIVAELEGHHG